ncbi:PP0621 family protein [Achromobacter seleniivolatilans]|uniref:PP0621 family protein n=1 Tax=Achromobacter seleniivolatilans TaxID=3047478 RepID=A0ABY9LYX6_9BURK|nr:PP0621 family protein [Achromobacter sp. R39]WMD19964.1 PP0621 family protein [Achromobacter sp. R39]
MGKLLFWVVLIIAVLFVARVAARMAAARQAGEQGGQKARGKTPPPKPLESMVRCAHCGIHLPRSEALLQDGKIWCSEDHAKRGAA